MYRIYVNTVSEKLLIEENGLMLAAFDFASYSNELLRKTAGLSPSAAADSILSSVRHWPAKQDDNLTVLVCDYVST